MGHQISNTCRSLGVLLSVRPETKLGVHFRDEFKRKFVICQCLASTGYTATTTCQLIGCAREFYTAATGIIRDHQNLQQQRENIPTKIESSIGEYTLEIEFSFDCRRRSVHESTTRDTFY